jgi:hypothetical protein
VVGSDSEEAERVVESLANAQRIVFAPELLTASAVAAAWGYHFGQQCLAGTGRWYAIPLAVLLGTLALFFAAASVRVWMRKVGWVRWLAVAAFLWSLFGVSLRLFLGR